jgi:hypothetical protein
MYCRRLPARKSRYALSNASVFRVVPISSFAIIIITHFAYVRKTTSPPPFTQVDNNREKRVLSIRLL